MVADASREKRAAAGGAVGGRAALRSVQRLLRRARDGAGGTIVVAGGSASGKSALCRAAAASARGFQVLRARPAAAEAELPYAALGDLLAPVLPGLARLPEAQQAALRAALALGPPVESGRLAVCAATLGLLADATAETPLVVVVDDAHWADAASAEALLFAARRLAGGRAAFVIAVDATAESPFSALVDLQLAAPQRAGNRTAELLHAAEAERRAGRSGRALELLDEALETADDARLRADVQHRRGVVTMWLAAPARAARHLLAEAARIAPLDTEKAVRMTIDAAWASFLAGELDNGLEAAEHALALARPGDGVAELSATGVLAIGKLLSGSAADALPLLERYEPLLDDETFLARGHALAWPAAQALVWLDRYEQARATLTAVLEHARRGGPHPVLPHALITSSELEFRAGDWTAAESDATQALRAAEVGQPVARVFALLALARLEAARGRERDCTAHVFEAVRLAPSGAIAVSVYAGAALGALELALGRADATVSHLEHVAQRVAEHGLEDPGVVPYAADLVEAYVRCGRVSDAVETLERLDEQAAATARPSALGAVRRCRGLLEPRFDEPLREAIDLQQAAPFERARTELCLGERLRRARRRAEARAPLRAALDTFERLEADAWAARTRTELRATGETSRRGLERDRAQLTPQERAIAELVAEGATNREVAAAVFLSPKTIETHLGRVYRKLDVRSRTELARRLASGISLLPTSQGSPDANVREILTR